MQEADVSTMSVRRLKAELTARGVRFDDCTERHELVTRFLISAPPAERQQACQQPRADGGRRAPDPSDRSPEADAVRRVLACGAGQYYKVLGVPSNIDDDGLRKSYRSLALRLHPDKCRVAGADEAFKRVGHAFASLKDPQTRAAHDLAGGDAATPSSATRRHYEPSRRHGFGDRDAEELFRAFFGDATYGAASHGSHGARSSSVAPQSATEVVERGLSLGRRLLSTFASNPWTLVTLLSCGLRMGSWTRCHLMSVRTHTREWRKTSGWQI